MLVNRELLKAYYEKRQLPSSDLTFAIAAIEEMESFLAGTGLRIEEADEAALDEYVQVLVHEQKNTIPMFVAMMRYFFVTGRTDLYIRLTQYTGGNEVIETILSRAERELGKASCEALMDGLSIPALGTPPKTYPAFTARFIRQMKQHCPESRLEPVMAGNNHQLPLAAFAEERKKYEESPSLEAYLNDLHDRQVAILQRHCEEKRVWFEQDITQGVVDLVKGNPEIQSAVIRNGKLYTTKIPYDGKHMLEETDPRLRRYHACHCPFVREAILRNDPDIDPDWCLCSAGFSKFEFESVLGHPLKAKVLNSALLGDEFCRFELDLTGVPYKK